MRLNGQDTRCRYVDLPETVSGFATVIEGSQLLRSIERSPALICPIRYPTNWAIEVLHSVPRAVPIPPWIPLSEDLQEFQAMMSASTWFLEAPEATRRRTMSETRIRNQTWWSYGDLPQLWP